MYRPAGHARNLLRPLSRPVLRRQTLLREAPFDAVSLRLLLGLLVPLQRAPQHFRLADGRVPPQSTRAQAPTKERPVSSRRLISTSFTKLLNLNRRWHPPTYTNIDKKGVPARRPLTGSPLRHPGSFVSLRPSHDQPRLRRPVSRRLRIHQRLADLRQLGVRSLFFL
jgi:hypothetical protein